MQIELYIDGEKKVFTAPYVPMLAKRKFLEIEARAEEKRKKDKHYIPSPQEQLEEENELISILTDVIFKGQFTIEQVYEGASDEYVYEKLREAIYGKRMDETGNEQGK